MKIHCLYDKMVQVGLLTPHPKNRNRHPDEQLKRLADILKYQGWRYPIKVSKLSGFITSGHGRLEAARLLGLKEVPVNFQDYESEEQEYADLTADNAIALWAEIDLAGINADLPDLGPDFNIDMLGLKDFILEPADKLEPGADEDEIPEKVEPKTKLGDLYVLGNHRLLCGDSKDINQVDKLKGGVEVELLLTDPPYGMSVVKADGNIGGNRVGKNGYGKKGQYDKKAECGVYKPIIGDDKPFDPNCCFGLTAHQIIFGANHFAHDLPNSPHWIVWYKDMPVGTDFSGAELAWTSIDKKAVKTYKFTWAGMTREGNRKDELSKRVHPTQKPVGLFEAILKDYDFKTVLDLFGGSGSILIACEKTNRKCFMMELDPHYADIIVARWEKYTGKKAVLLTENNEARNEV